MDKVFNPFTKKPDYTGGSGGGAGDVTAASVFGTDNVLIRSDGSGKGLQATGITVNDSDVLVLPVNGNIKSTDSSTTASGLNIFPGDSTGSAIRAGDLLLSGGYGASTGVNGGDLWLYGGNSLDTAQGKVKVGDNSHGFGATINAASLTADRVFTFPDAAGTLALTSDVPAIGGSNTQIQFNDGGAFGGDSQLIWNKTTNRLGIGGAPDQLADFTSNKLQLVDTDGTNSDFLMFSGGSGTPSFEMATARGSIGSLTATQAGDNAGVVRGWGYGGTQFKQAAYIQFEISGGTPSDTSMPGSILFCTVPVGSTTPVVRGMIRQDGTWGIGNNGPASTLELTGTFHITRPTTTVDTTLGTTSSSFRGVNATTGNKTMTLPAASAGISGRLYYIEKTDSSANTVTIATSSSQLIDGASTYVLTKQYQTVAVMATSSGWTIAFAAGSSSGATDNAIVRYDGTTGKLAQNSGAILDDTGNLLNPGYLRVGSTTAPAATTAGNLTVDTLVSVGRDEASGTTGRFWKGSGTMTGTANGADYYMHMQPTIAPASNSLTDFRMLGFDAIVAPATTITLDTLIGGYFQMRLRHDGATNDIIGAQAFGAVLDSSSAATVGTVTIARGFHAGIYSRASGTSVVSITTGIAYDVSTAALAAGVTIGTGIGLRVQNPSAPAAMTSWIGADFGAFTRAATDNIGVRIATPSGATNNYALQLSGTGGTAAAGITFGTDLQVYRVAASVLVNSGSERIATYLNVGAITAPTNTTAGDITFIRGFMTGNLTITDANIVLSATTGTKIGTATTQKLAFYNSTPIVQPSAYTQTYSTADKTHANFTSADITGITSSTTGSVLAEPSAAYTQSEMQQNFRRLQDQHNALKADVADLKQLVNSLIDDMQSLGLVG